MNRQELVDAIPHCLTQTNLPLPNKYPGKVRDTYDLGNRLLLVTTDRQSGFDRMLGAIPYKGQALIDDCMSRLGIRGTPRDDELA